MDSKISETSWQGKSAWLLESDAIETIVVPDLGAKLVSLFDKRTRREWLVGTGQRPFSDIAYGASFVDQDMSGWDEMFPTILACDYPAPGTRQGVPLPDHGEVWPLPWTLERAESGVLQMFVEGVALRYRLTRTICFQGSETLRLDYELRNLETDTMPYLWAAHPQFDCGDQAEVVLPQTVGEVCNAMSEEWGWGEPETRFAWPEAATLDGQSLRIDRIGPRSRQQARKFFVAPENPVSWAGLLRWPKGDWLRMAWNPDVLPYLGIWIDEGSISHASVVALEPMTGYYDSLDTAWKKGLVAMVGAGETMSWSLYVTLGVGQRDFPANENFA